MRSIAAPLRWTLVPRTVEVEGVTYAFDALPSFEARTSDGSAWHSDELSGKRVLLKFFRGHW